MFYFGFRCERGGRVRSTTFQESSRLVLTVSIQIVEYSLSGGHISDFFENIHRAIFCFYCAAFKPDQLFYGRTCEPTNLPPYLPVLSGPSSFQNFHVDTNQAFHLRSCHVSTRSKDE